MRTFSLGAGTDVVKVIAAGTSNADVDTIANFKAGGADVIVLGTNTKAATDIKDITNDIGNSSYANVEAVLSALGTANKFTTGSDKVDYFVWNGDTYIVAAAASNTFATTDYLVKLTGTGYDLTAEDILAKS